MHWYSVALVLMLSVSGLSCRGTVLSDNRPQGQPAEPPSGEGWVDLLDAEHAPNWQATNKKKLFEIEEGVLHILGGPSGYVLYGEEQLDDFALHLEFKLDTGSNSGVMFRAAKEDPVFKGMEIQVYGDQGKPPTNHSCGALYDVATPMFNMSRPAGEWNSYDMVCGGSHVELVMNGWKVLDVDLSKMTMPIGKFPTPLAELPRKGWLLLQNHRDEVWYRNVRLKKM